MDNIKSKMSRAMRLAASNSNTESNERINEIVEDALADVSVKMMRRFGVFIIKKFSTDEVYDDYAKYYAQYLVDEFIKTLTDDDE